MFGALSTIEGAPPDVLAEVAREFSPRIEVCSPTEIVLDLSGLTRLFGEARTIAEELRRTAADRGLRVRVAIAGTRTAARLLVRYRAGLTIVEPGNEAAAVAPLPIELLGDVCGLGIRDSDVPSSPADSDLENPELTPNDPESRIPDQLATFRRWGLRTLGDLAALPSDDLAARLGRQDTDWQRLARGEDRRPLVPAVPEERFEQTLDLEWPIEELEPLSFVLGRLMEPLEAHLEQRDRGAAVLHVRLHLIKTDGTTREVHERSLQLPAPIRDARTLRTLALLDLESHPPAAAIDRVVGGRRSDAGAHRAVLAAHASAAVTGTDLHAHGTSPCADGRDALRIAGNRRLVAARGVRDEAVYAADPGPGTRGPGFERSNARIPDPGPRIPSDGRTPSFPPSGPHRVST